MAETAFPSEQFANGTFQIINPARIGDIFHVGTMDISQKSKFSHEGNGLSISNCPDAWCRITEGYTHGDCFKLSKPNLKLLDFYALTEKEKEQIQNWALENGYVKQGALYKSFSFDEEGNEYFSLYDNYDSALEESDFDKDRVEAVSGLLPTQKLLDQSLVKVELLDVPDIITEIYAEQVLDYDGIYWDEILDVASYSAPRGVIFNSKLPSFDVVNITQEKAKKHSIDAQIQSAYTWATEAHCTSDVQPKAHEPEL